MASEGGFKIHLAGHGDKGAPSVIAKPPVREAPEPSEAVAPVAAKADSKPTPPAPDVVEPTRADPLPSKTRPSTRSVTATWLVAIRAEGEGDSVTPELADAFLAGLRERGARVSTEKDASCQYSAELSVNADGVLTAVLQGISHFQAAASVAQLPAVRIVSISARDTERLGDDHWPV